MYSAFLKRAESINKLAFCVYTARGDSSAYRFVLAKLASQIAACKEDRSRAVFVAYRRLLEEMRSYSRYRDSLACAAKAERARAVDITFSWAEIARAHNSSVRLKVLLF